jgi:hypothetical protein
MEEQGHGSGATAARDQAKPVAWRDLREWLSLVDAEG